MHILGIDIGTTTISIVLLDEESGALIARETVSHGAFIDDGCPVGKVQDPEKIWNIVRERCDGLIGAHGQPGCIGLTGQMHGMLYVDAGGRAVSPLYTWQDGRGNLPMDDGRSYVACLRASGCGAAASGYGLATHFYLMKNGGVPADAAKMTTISDYIAMKLTGNAEPVLGADMAASWGCFDLQARCFRTEAMAALGMDAQLLPRVTTVHEVIGHTPAGVPVVVSLGDNQASVLGSVQDLEDTVLINVGTGSQVSVGTGEYIACEGSIELRPCTGESYICVGSGLCGGRAYAMLEQFYSLAAGDGSSRYDFMLEQAEEFLEKYGYDQAWKVKTTFSGTRDNPEERGSIGGIGVENFHPGALTVGVIAGILEELHQAYVQISAKTGRKPGRLVGSGNGLRRNPLMQQIAREMFGLELMIPAHQEEAAYGAALCAMAASGRAESLKAAQAKITYL